MKFNKDVSKLEDAYQTILEKKQSHVEYIEKLKKTGKFTSAVPCTSHHMTFGGKCLNCGYKPEDQKEAVTERFFAPNKPASIPEHTIKTKIDYTGEAQITRTVDGWQVLLFDPLTKTMKPAAEVLGEMAHNKTQDSREQQKQAVGKVGTQKHGAVDLAKFDKYAQ